METVTKGSSDIFSAAVRKLDITVLVSQLTFVRVLAEGFDFLAKDGCNGLDILAELCEMRADDLKRLGMEDEAELLVHITENLKCAPSDKPADETSPGDKTDEIDVLYRIEFVRIIMQRLIDRLEKETSGIYAKDRQAA